MNARDLNIPAAGRTLNSFALRNGINPLTQADFYKMSHRAQYEPGTEEVYSNFTPRSARLAPVLEGFDNKVVWFGLQGFIKNFLVNVWNENFFGRPKEEVVALYKRRMDTALGPDAIPVDHIEALWDLGYLPIEIKALPEGSRVNIRVPVLTIKNTLPEFFWLTNYLETVMSNELWKPATIATIAYEYRKLLEEYAEKTGAPREFIDWQAHDFSCRGMSGYVDSMMSSAGHLLSFTGTDTIAAIDYLEDFYNANSENELIGGSVPATEHSVMCLSGEQNELETFRRLICDVYPSGIVSIVSDSWDFWRVITEYARTLRQEILGRTPNALGQAKVVFRPDSGDPVKILTGYRYETFDTRNQVESASWLTEETEAVYILSEKKYFELEGLSLDRDDCVTGGILGKELSEAEVMGAVECLWGIFGGSQTEKGYKVLHERVGLIYGDSITLARAQAIMARLAEKKFASCNVVFGVGSYSYQYLTRDSFGFAVKATSGVVNGVRRAVAKDPKTDSGTKKSAVGLLRVEKEGDDFVLYDNQTVEQEQQGALRTVFKNGELLVDDSLSAIRARLRG